MSQFFDWKEDWVTSVLLVLMILGLFLLGMVIGSSLREINWLAEFRSVVGIE